MTDYTPRDGDTNTDFPGSTTSDSNTTEIALTVFLVIGYIWAIGASIVIFVLCVLFYFYRRKTLQNPTAGGASREGRRSFDDDFDFDEPDEYESRRAKKSRRAKPSRKKKKKKTPRYEEEDEDGNELDQEEYERSMKKKKKRAKKRKEEMYEYDEDSD